MLLTAVVFVMGMINAYFTPERTRALLAGMTEGAANVKAASLGIGPPFCPCSAVRRFIGYLTCDKRVLLEGAQHKDALRGFSCRDERGR